MLPEPHPPCNLLTTSSFQPQISKNKFAVRLRNSCRAPVQLLSSFRRISRLSGISSASSLAPGRHFDLSSCSRTTFRPVQLLPDALELAPPALHLAPPALQATLPDAVTAASAAAERSCSSPRRCKEHAQFDAQTSFL